MSATPVVFDPRIDAEAHLLDLAAVAILQPDGQTAYACAPPPLPERSSARARDGWQGMSGLPRLSSTNTDGLPLRG